MSAEEPGGASPRDERGLAGHDPSGLELARSIARAYRGGGAEGARGGLSRWRRPRRQAAAASGAHPDDRDPQRLAAAIERLVAEHGWQTEVAVHAVFARWDAIVGAAVAAHCRPERYADAELVVRADSTAWATQMRLLAGTVVRRLNAELGDGAVVRIQVLGPQAPSWRRGPRSVRDGRGPRDTYG